MATILAQAAKIATFRGQTLYFTFNVARNVEIEDLTPKLFGA
jgi:hypothetical protein